MCLCVLCVCLCVFAGVFFLCAGSAEVVRAVFFSVAEQQIAVQWLNLEVHCSLLCHTWKLIKGCLFFIARYYLMD